MPSPDRDQAKAHLDRLWSDVKHEQVALRMDADTQAGIAALIASERVTFTYSVATQLLGELTDHRLDTRGSSPRTVVLKGAPYVGRRTDAG